MRFKVGRLSVYFTNYWTSSGFEFELARLGFGSEARWIDAWFCLAGFGIFLSWQRKR